MINRIVSHYRILEKIGAGGMGIVYKAEDTKLKRTVALKFLPVEATRDPENKSRFLHEARAAAALDHPNICTVHEIDETAEGMVFMVMTYYTGRTLNERVKEGPLAISEALDIAIQTAEGLSQAHQKGIIHRDIKPGNILLGADGRVKILDFGLAKLAGATILTRDGTTMGTVSYMSPEQVRGEATDRRTDIWSLGVVLYEMLIGRSPFAGEYPQSIMYGIQNEIPAPLTSLRTGVPLQLERIVNKTLAKAPAERYQFLEDMLVDLRAIKKTLLKQEPTTVSIPTPGSQQPTAETAALGRATGQPSRRRLILTLGSIILSILAILLWFKLKHNPEAGRGETASVPQSHRSQKTSANAEANEYFEKGLFFLNAQLDLPRARQMLERALALDGTFAEARAWYAFTFFLMIDIGISNDSKWIYKAEEELRRALKDDPDSARAHSALAAIYYYSARKESVRIEAEKALAISPDDEDGENWLANYYLLNGDYATAQKLHADILAHNPLFFPARMMLGEGYRLQGNIPAAIREQEKVLELDPKNIYAIEKLSRAYIDAGNLPLARQTLERLPAANRQNYTIKISWALVLILEGKNAEAHKEMDKETLKYAAIATESTSVVADFYALAGDPVAALDWLERSVRNGDERDEWFRRDPLLQSIRALPRFQQILNSITLRKRQGSSVKDDRSGSIDLGHVSRDLASARELPFVEIGRGGLSLMA